MSGLAKAALIIIIMHVFLFIAFPQAQLGKDVVEKFIYNAGDVMAKRESKIYVGGEFNNTLVNATNQSSVGESQILPDYVAKAIAIVSMIAGIMTSPLAVGNYLLGIGAPPEAILLYATIILAAYGLAIMDWIRSGG